MKVYLLELWDYNESQVVAVYLDKDSAEEDAEKVRRGELVGTMEYPHYCSTNSSVDVQPMEVSGKVPNRWPW